MSDVTIYGFPVSTYVRTVRMACAEKGVAYDLEPNPPHSPEQLAVHPFGRVPALRHRDLVLFETGAIGRYIDRVFEGPPLVPAEPVAAARMDQWFSAIGNYLYPVGIGEVVLRRIGWRPMDEAALGEAAKTLEHHVGVLDGALDPGPWLAGEALTLADLALAPIVFYLAGTPEGQAALAKAPRLQAWFEQIGNRESFTRTAPPPPGG